MPFRAVVIFCLCVISAFGSIRNKTGKISLPLNHSSSCPDYGIIENGEQEMSKEMSDVRSVQALLITCNPGYDLTGHPKVFCTDGQWERIPRPKCLKRCLAPPFMLNAEIVIEGLKDEHDRYYKSSSATYNCGPGFRLFPENSKFRTCNDGRWTGTQGTCISDGCERPPEITYGYYVLKSLTDGGGGATTDGVVVAVGQRAHYSCNLGYMLDGPEILQCIETGGWSPRLAPQCVKMDKDASDDTSNEDNSCAALHPPAHSVVTAVRGVHSANSATDGTCLEIKCKPGYRDERYPCEVSTVTCEDGVWQGWIPNCELVDGCLPPASIEGGTVVGLYFNDRYQVNTEVAYACRPGRVLSGAEIYRCQADGCWEPQMAPKCDYAGLIECGYGRFLYSTHDYTAYVWLVTSLAAMLFLVGIGACLIIVCRRKRRLTIHRPSHHRSRRLSNPGSGMPPPGVVNSTTLLHDPDRVALIAFADGVTLGESLLPSYEEAIRDQRGHVIATSAGLLGARTLRPHWGPPRRTRGQGSMPGDAHVTRQSSSTSHSASLRSGGESMGSTDTMTASDVSTNVTLDTVSSHTCSSGSQSASCRAIFGSLASFDTTSVLNTEGVPLLEENEMEDGVLGSSPILSIDQQVQDNGSYKYRQAGGDLA